MGFCSRSWEGQNILIFGREPSIPVRLHKRIAESAPALEPLLVSFEVYEDALEYVKAEKTVGTILLCEDGKTPSIKDIAKNLLGPYRASGWPGFACLISPGDPTLQGYETIVNDSTFNDYISISAFEGIEVCRITLKKLWENFIVSHENFLLGGRFRATLIDKAIHVLGSGPFLFRERLSYLLRENMDLSWRDDFCVTWASIIECVNQTDPVVLMSHGDLKSITKNYIKSIPPTEYFSLDTIGDHSLALSSRIGACVEAFTEAYVKDSLNSVISLFTSIDPNTSTGLVKHIIRNVEQIISFAQEARSMH